MDRHTAPPTVPREILEPRRPLAGILARVADVRDPDFYLEHAGYVRALARRLVYDPHAADDLFQAAWLAALQRPLRDERTPRRWLSRIVRNLASKAWLRSQRRERREQQWEPPPPASTPAAVLAHEQERRRLVEALLALDEPYRATLIARFFDGLEPAQIAERDSVPVETVRTRQKRGLERLRERLLRGDGAVMALVHGLQVGAPPTHSVLVRALRVMLLMHTKKLLLSAGILVVAVIGWLAVPPASPKLGEIPPPAPVAAASAAVPKADPTSAPPPRGDAEAPVRSAPPAPATAAASGSLRVHVRWADQRPANDIGVRVGVSGASNFEAHVLGGRTGPDGSVAFERLEPGEVWVECDRGAQQAVQVRGGQRSVVTLSIEPGVRIRGRVIDLDDRPAAGASVYLLHRFQPYAGHVVARAAEDGTFTIEDAPADRAMALSAFAPGRTPSPQQVVTAHAGAEVAVELRFAARGGAVAGRALDEHGEPVEGAMVLVGEEGGFPFERAKAAGLGALPPVASRRTTTDGRGEWVVDGVAAGETPVLVLTPRFAPWTGTVPVAEGATTRCDAVLLPGARLEGVVHDERGAVCAGAVVQVACTSLQTWRTRADVSGAYALEGLPLAPFDAKAEAAGAGEARTRCTGAAGATLRWDPVLLRAVTLRGTVRAAGQPVARARIDARCMPAAQRQWFADTTTDGEGRFAITNCPDALLHLEVHTEASQPFAVCRRDDVDPRAGEVALEVDAARVPSACVTGRVLGPDGAPFAGADVTVLTHDYEWGGGRSMTTGADGRFRSEVLPPGAWYLTVHVEGHAQISVPERTLAAGATVDFGDLVLTRGGTLHITLQPENGLALGECIVGLADAVTGLGSVRAEQGAVSFPHLAPGDYQVTAYAPGAALRPLAVHVGDEPETTLVLPIASGSEVTVDVLDARGEPVDDRLETELFDGAGVRIDLSPLMPGSGPMHWVRRLVADHYELRLRNHRGEVAVLPFAVAAGGKPVQATARFR